MNIQRKTFCYCVSKFPTRPNKIKGFTLIELSLAIIISAFVMLGLNGILNTALQANQISSKQNAAMQQARFAMQQMVRAIASSQRLLLPLGENPNTAWSESVRDVLAVTLSPNLDRDKDGWADANNDKDYLDINNNGSRDIGETERIDEDTSNDMTNDNKSGIIFIDDDGDGNVDEDHNDDDDEDGTRDEDLLGKGDEDNDGSIDEDLNINMNGDGSPGIQGYDDDFDGSVDEGNKDDDDEDGLRDEDWIDPVVFFLNGNTLMQRIPNINPTDGTDYGEYTIAENITQLRIERISGNDGQSVLVDITLTISPPDTEAISLNTSVRIGASL